MSQRKIGALLSYATIGIQTILGFAYVPILLFYMGTSEYGLYQLMGAIIGYLAIMDFGLTTTTIRFYSKFLTENQFIKAENFLALIQRVYAVLIFLMILLGIIIYQFLDFSFASGLTANELNQAKKIYILLIINLVITLA